MALVGCGRSELDSLGGEGTGNRAADTAGSAKGWLAFQVRQDVAWTVELRAVDVSGQDPMRVLSPAPYNLQQYGDLVERLKWAPDGTALIYQASRPVGGAYRQQLFLVDFLGGESRSALPIETEDANSDQSFWDPHWAADSRSIGFEVAHIEHLRSRTYWAKVLDRVPEPARLVQDGTQSSRVRWSPDGYKVVYERGFPTTREYDDELIYVDLESGEPTSPTRLYPAFPTFGIIYLWDWSPDGNWVAYSRPSESDPCGLYAVRFEAGEASPPLRLGSDLKSCDHFFHWAPDSRKIQLASNPVAGTDWILQFVSLDSTPSSPAVVLEETVPAGWRVNELFWLDADRVILAVTDNNGQRECRLIDFREQPVSKRLLHEPIHQGGSFLATGPTSIGLLYEVCTSHCATDDEAWVHELYWADLMSDEPPRSLGLYTSEYDDSAFSSDRLKLVVEARKSSEDKGVRGLFLLDFGQGSPTPPVQIDERKHVYGSRSPYSRLAWSSNGQAIAFTGDDVALFWMDMTVAHPSKPRALTKAGESIAGYAWRPGG